MVTTIRVNDTGTAREALAHGQQRSSDLLCLRSGSTDTDTDTDDSGVTVDEMGVGTPSMDEATIARPNDTAATKTDESSSPVLYKQRTNS
jgi:hypothetical protein